MGCCDDEPDNVICRPLERFCGEIVCTRKNVLRAELVITVEVRVGGMLKAMQEVKSVLIGFQWGVRTRAH